MSLLSKSEIQFLQGNKQISKSYEYKLKSIIKKKISNLLDKEIPLINSLFPNSINNLTEFSKIPKVGVEAITEKIHSPVKHCCLSSRRSRVQIPAGAHYLNNNSINKNKKPQYRRFFDLIIKSFHKSKSKSF
jgi:hypothetical protein